MARISSISLKQQAGYNVLSIRKTINFLNDYSDFVGQSYDKIIKHLDNLNILSAGDPFVCFHNMDLENLDVEAGFPIENPIESEGEMISKKIPSQKIVLAIDLGSYEKQNPTLEEIFN